MLPGLSTVSMLSSAGGVSPGARPSLPIESVNAPESPESNLAAISYSYSPETTYGSAQYTQSCTAVYTSTVYGASSFDLYGKRRIRHSYRSTTSSNQKSWTRWGKYNPDFTAIEWGTATSSVIADYGLSGSYTATYYRGGSTPSRPSNSDFQSAAAGALAKNRNSLLSPGGSLGTKVYNGRSYMIRTGGVTVTPVTVPIGATDPAVFGTPETVLLETPSDAPNTFKYSVQLLGALPNGDILIYLNKYVYKRNTVFIYKQNGTLDQQLATPISFIGAGVYNRLLHTLALVDSDEVLHYFSMSDLTTPIESIDLGRNVDNAAWPDGEPLYFNYRNGTVFCLKP